MILRWARAGWLVGTAAIVGGIGWSDCRTIGLGRCRTDSRAAEAMLAVNFAAMADPENEHDDSIVFDFTN